jgi:rhodanese-related sulfurtransferase
LTPLTLDGIWNLRDLGARPVSPGGRIRSGKVFRCGTLWFATMQDCNVMAGLEVDSVIDLRLPQEELHEEDWLCELLDTRYYHLPIAVPDDPSPIALMHPGGAEHYLRLLEHNAARYVKALELISEPDNHPILFHCAGGHDRSGVLAALVLACLDVDDADIVEDYVDSSQHMPAIADKYRDHALYGSAAAQAAQRAVDGDVMAEFLALAGGREGLTKWAIANGFAEASLMRMRDALIER